MIFNFYIKDKEGWEKQKTMLFEILGKGFLGLKNFSVKIGDVEKTPKQLRGFFRICGLLAPYLQESEGVLMDRDLVKEYVKQECNYCISLRGKIVTKSLAHATRDEMTFLIKRLYEICDAEGVENYELTSYEMQALIQHYEEK